MIPAVVFCIGNKAVEGFAEDLLLYTDCVKTVFNMCKRPYLFISYDKYLYDLLIKVNKVVAAFLEKIRRGKGVCT